MSKTYPKNFYAINEWMQSYVRMEKFSGSSVLIAKNNEIIHNYSCGFRDKDKKAAFDLNTVVRIYSMSKPITALALIILEDEGKVDLNAPISEFIPAFSNTEALVEGATGIHQTRRVSPPNLAQLLNHTSGVSYPFNSTLIGKCYASAMTEYLNFRTVSGPIGNNITKMNLEVLCDKLAQFPLSFSPGSQWEYSMGLDLIGRVIEIISGLTLEKFLRINIFEKVGMRDTSFYLRHNMRTRLAECEINKKYQETHQYYRTRAAEYEKENVKLFLGGSGLLSTITDYHKFTSILSNKGFFGKEKIISEVGLNKMIKNSLKSDIATIGPKTFALMPTKGMGYSLGGSVIIKPHARFSSTLGDFGWGGMASTYFWVDFKNKATAIFLTQLIPSDSYSNRAEIKTLVRKILKLA